MANKIREYESQGSVKTGFVGPRVQFQQQRAVSASDMMTIPANAGAQVGQALAPLQNALEERMARTEALWVHETMAGAKKYWIENFDKMKEAATKNGTAHVDFSKQFEKGYAQFIKQQGKGAPSVRAREDLEVRLTDMGVSLFGQATTFESRSRVKKNAESLANVAASLQSTSIVANSSDQINDLKNNLNEAAAVTTGIVPPSVVKGIVEKGQADMDRVQIPLRAAEIGVDAVREEVEGKKLGGALNPWELSSILNNIEQREIQNKKVAQDITEKHKRDLVASIMNGGPMPTATELDSFARSYALPRSNKKGDNVKAIDIAYKNEVAQAGMFSTVRSALHGKPETTALAILNKFKELDPSSEFHDRLNALHGQWEKLKKDDPGAYAMISPAVQEASNEAAQLLQKYEQAPSPETLEVAKRAWDEYATRSLLVQKESGVANPQVIAKSYANTMASELSSLFNESPIKAVERIDQLVEIFGEHTDNVFKTMYKQPEISRGIQIVAGLPRNSAARVDLAQSLRPSSVDKKTPLLDKKDTLDALAANETWMNFIRSNNKQIYQDSEVVEAEMVALVSHYAEWRSDRGGDPIGDSVNTIISGLFHFAEVNGKVVRVPREFAPNVDGDSLSSMLEATIRQKVEKDEINLSSWMGDFSESDPDRQKELAQSIIQRDAFWAPDDRLDSAELGLFVESGGQVSALVDKNGNRVKISIKQLGEQNGPVIDDISRGYMRSGGT